MKCTRCGHLESISEPAPTADDPTRIRLICGNCKRFQGWSTSEPIVQIVKPDASTLNLIVPDPDRWLYVSKRLTIVSIPNPPSWRVKSLVFRSLAHGNEICWRLDPNFYWWLHNAINASSAKLKEKGQLDHAIEELEKLQEWIAKYYSNKDIQRFRDSPLAPQIDEAMEEFLSYDRSYSRQESRETNVKKIKEEWNRSWGRS